MKVVSKNNQTYAHFLAGVCHKNVKNKATDWNLVPLVNDATACQQECVKSTLCKYWSYQKSTRICFFQKEQDFDDKVEDDWVSGPKEC